MDDNNMERILKELENQKLLVEAYRNEVEKYKTWWLKECEKTKGMIDDIEVMQKLTLKLVERWKR